MDRITSTRPPLRVATEGDQPTPSVPDADVLPERLATLSSFAELLNAETRLLARAVGGHLPIELALEVEELRARRAALARPA